MAFLLITLLVILIFIGSCFIHYKIWRKKLIKQLNSRSSILYTSMGPVEYASIGPEDGPVFLLSHGGGTGYDNAFLYDFLIKEGFRVICPSKPGYLRTPLAVGEGFDKHADMFAAVLEALNISKKVAIAGVSLGGPAALQFALKYQDKITCLIMQDAVSHAYGPCKEAEDSILGKLFLSPSSRKFLTWLMTVSAYLWPKAIFSTYLQVESLYDKKKTKEITNIVMKDPLEVKKIKEFAEVVAPLDLRAPGMDSEMKYAKELPRYPLENIKVPVLVTQSTMDRDVLKKHAEFIVNTAPNVEVYYFEGCGHMFWFGDEWPIIQSKLVNFLKKHA